MKRRAAAMTFVIIGGGPTGVEMAGAIAEISRYTLAKDFRHIDPSRARVILIEGESRLLSAFPEDLSQSAQKTAHRSRRRRAHGRTSNES
jgi:NADH dehydrogenase, FAD-containing subunit